MVKEGIVQLKLLEKITAPKNIFVICIASPAILLNFNMNIIFSKLNLRSHSRRLTLIMQGS